MTDIRVVGQKEVLGKVLTVYGTQDSPLFIAKDVAEWIEHSRASEMLKTVDENEKLIQTTFFSGQNRKMWFLTLSGLYTVLANSRKRESKVLLSLLDKDYPLHRLTTVPLQTKYESQLLEALEALSEELTDIVAIDDTMLHFESEKALGPYRADMVFPNLRVVVEYDEVHHLTQQGADKEREKFIEEHAGFKVFRIRQGKELVDTARLLGYISKVTLTLR